MDSPDVDCRYKTASIILPFCVLTFTTGNNSTTSKLVLYTLKMASYPNPNLVTNGMNVNKPAAVAFSVAGIVKMFNHNKFTPNTTLQEHPCCILGFALHTTIMIGLKYKQGRAFLSSLSAE